LEEIAERLGYGEMSNFMHAFKRWKGVTPGQFRRSGV
jgi:AraC-like DNA-binding protein